MVVQLDVIHKNKFKVLSFAQIVSSNKEEEEPKGQLHLISNICLISPHSATEAQNLNILELFLVKLSCSHKALKKRKLLNLFHD